jgi:hypothetical protein
MYEELVKDKIFVARFLHFLDVVFNNFCDDLAEYHTRNNPIESAFRRLRGRMKDDIDRVMRDIHHGITPNLPLPIILEREEQWEPKKDEAPTPSKCRPQGEEDKKLPAWWSKNPEMVEVWVIPDDKDMKDLFTSFSPKGKENSKCLPHARHHNPVISGKKPLCIKYQCWWKCRIGCPQAHVKPTSMTEDVRAKVTEVFQKTYE